MTIAGAGATAFNFLVNGQRSSALRATPRSPPSFSDGPGFVPRPFSFLGPKSAGFPYRRFPGLTQQSWVYCNNFDPTHCTPNTAGNWTAVAVPEPPGLALFLLGLGIMALAGVTRRRSA